jgi:hypothetical protein
MKQLLLYLFLLSSFVQAHDGLQIMKASGVGLTQSVTIFGSVGLGFAVSEAFRGHINLKQGAMCAVGLYSLVWANRKLSESKQARIQENLKQCNWVSRTCSDIFTAAGLVAIPYCVMEMVRLKGVNVRFGLGSL